jgi:hypothetical protein
MSLLTETLPVLNLSIILTRYYSKVMKLQSYHNDSTTIFSFKDHTAFMKKAARIRKAKFLGYHVSKLLVVFLLCVGLVSAGSLEAFAGGKTHRGGTKIHKSVTAKAGNKNHFGGNSHSKASVHNNNSVHINSGSGGGGRTVVLRRGGGKGGKKVTRVHKSSNKGNKTHKSNGGNNHKSKKSVKKVINHTTVNNYQSNPCDMYDCATTSDGRIVIINKNNNYNSNTNTNSYGQVYTDSYPENDDYTDSCSDTCYDDSTDSEDLSYLGY